MYVIFIIYMSYPLCHIPFDCICSSMYHICYIPQNRYNMCNNSLSLSLSIKPVLSIPYSGVNFAVCSSELQYEVMSF